MQRHVAFCLFYPGNVLNVRGMLAKSYDGVDRRLLLPAVEAVLANEDGRARGTVVSVYDKVGFDDLRPLLPAIYKAVAEPAPSGEMFADGIRLRGLELLAANRVAEGLPLCVRLCEPDRCGAAKRIGPCVRALERYAAAAKSELPALRDLLRSLESVKKPDAELVAEVKRVITVIEASTTAPTLRSLAEAAAGK